jgi:hypothetical protein
MTDSADELFDILQNFADAPETRAWTFAAHGPGSEVVTYGETSDSGDDSHVVVLAALLKQYADYSDKNSEEFLKEVVRAFNERETEVAEYR